VIVSFIIMYIDVGIKTTACATVPIRYDTIRYEFALVCAALQDQFHVGDVFNVTDNSN